MEGTRNRGKTDEVMGKERGIGGRPMKSWRRNEEWGRPMKSWGRNEE